jgi:tetratricopeptide (TPR) repeat protein
MIRPLLLLAAFFSDAYYGWGLIVVSALPRSSQMVAANDQDDPQQLEGFLRAIKEGKTREVRPLLLRYLSAHPNSWRAYYQLGYVYFRERNVGRSVGALRKSLELNPQNAEPHKILGLDFAMLGNHDAAEDELEKASRLNPDSAEIRYYLGRIYYTHGSHPLAKKEFEAAIRLDPTYVKAFDNLGLAQEALGDNPAAIASY